MDRATCGSMAMACLQAAMALSTKPFFPRASPRLLWAMAKSGFNWMARSKCARA